MNRQIIGCALALVGFTISYGVSAGVVFNWVNEALPNNTSNPRPTLPGTGRVEVSNSVYLSAQSGVQQIFGTYVALRGSNPPPFQIDVRSADVTVGWRNTSTRNIVPVADCSVPLTCTPVFSSTKVLFADVGFSEAGIRFNSNWSEATSNASEYQYRANNFFLLGSDLIWNIGAPGGGWGSVGLTGGIATYAFNNFPSITGRWVLDQSTVPSEVPVPATLALLIVGIVGASLSRKRQPNV